MSSGVSSYGAETWLSALFGLADPITSYWVALCSDEPGTDMDGTVLGDLEPGDSSYTRVQYGTGVELWGTNTGFITNSDDIGFPTATGDWGDITHYALLTARVGGELYAWGEFLDPQYVTAGYQLLIPAGGLVIALAELDNPIAP